MSDSNSSALAVVEPSHVTTSLQHHRQATDVAGLVRAIVVGKAVQIGPRKYVPVDAYQAIANAMGCTTSARDVKRVEGGYTAIGEVKRLSDGAVLAEGEGFVGDDEPKWAKGPEYARRSMVQTRAIGRACRAAFAFVVPMIDLGLSSTPAEEMEGINQGTETPPPPRGTQALKVAMRPSPPQSTPPEPPPHQDADFRLESPRTEQPAHVPTTPPTHDRTVAYNFGKSKGVILGDLDEGSLKFYEGCFKRDLADAGKAQWHEKTRAQLANLTAEMRYRGL
jgi:hypothetical protein